MKRRIIPTRGAAGERLAFVDAPVEGECFDLTRLVGQTRAGVRTPTPDCIREYVLERDGRRCRKCTKAPPLVDLETHHIVAIQDGGDHRARNLITLCSMCHAEWTHFEPDDDFYRWLVMPPMRLLYEMIVRPVGLVEGSPLDRFRTELLTTWGYVREQQR